MNNLSVFFKNKGLEYVFYLTEISGRERMDKLDIRQAHYTLKKYAEDWHDNILNILEREELPVSLKEAAIKELEEIYKHMTS